LSRSNEMKKQIPVWECPRCSYVMRPTTAQEVRDGVIEDVKYIAGEALGGSQVS
jgi:hypothetical protein